MCKVSNLGFVSEMNKVLLWTGQVCCVKEKDESEEDVEDEEELDDEIVEEVSIESQHLL